MHETHRRILRLVAATAAVTLSVIAAGRAVVHFSSGVEPTGPSEVQRVRNKSFLVARARVQVAELEAEELINRRSENFFRWLSERKPHVKPFAGAVLSWEGRWKMVQSYLPFTDKVAYRKFVEEKFFQHLFSEPELRRQFELAVQESFRDLRVIHYRLVADLGRAVSDVRDPESHRAVMEISRLAIDRIQSDAQWYSLADFGRELVTNVAQKVAMLALGRLAVSSGILTTGASTSWFTMGASLVVSIGVDYALKQISNPAASFEREVLSWLDQLATSSRETIAASVQESVTGRISVWRESIEQIRTPGVP